MKKDDIKAGMVIELQDETQLLVTNADELLTSDGEVWGYFSGFNEDLTHYNDSESNIRCVWKHKYVENQSFELIDMKEMPIWERGPDEDIDESMYKDLENEVEKLLEQSEKIKNRIDEIYHALGLHP